MIGKVERTVTETGTTIDQKVELSQKGTIQVVSSLTSKLLAIPCNIPNPETLSLFPMTANAAIALNASTTEAIPYTDFVLHSGTGASLTFASIASGVLQADVGYRLRMDTASYSLFVAAASQAATTCASNSRLASNSLWHKVYGYASNAQKYLLVNIANSASDVYQAKKIKFKYEIRGY